jgi:hypothetical protein
VKVTKFGDSDGIGDGHGDGHGDAYSGGDDNKW